MLENSTPEHKLTLDTIKDPGCLYIDEEKAAEAEEMYMQALEGIKAYNDTRKSQVIGKSLRGSKRNDRG